jgi:hypothetical protein
VQSIDDNSSQDSTTVVVLTKLADKLLLWFLLPRQKHSHIREMNINALKMPFLFASNIVYNKCMGNVACST